MKIRKTLTTVALGAAMAVLMQVQTAQASFASLASLITPGATLTVGDKTFSGFSWFASGDNATVINTLNAEAAGLLVTASSAGGVYFLDFAGQITVNNIAGSAYLQGDLQLRYTVTVNSGPAVIDMIDQQYTPNALPAGNQIIIGETAVGLTAHANSTLTLNPSDIIDPLPEAGDNLLLVPGQTQLAVLKDILIAAAPGNIVGLSDVQQSFHQTSAVPEPTTVVASLLLLLPLGASTVKILRNRKASA
jgi:hypothetical protein